MSIQTPVDVIALSSIEEGERRREKYYSDSAEWTAFKESIRQKGLIQPIAVCHNPASDVGPTYLLIAGGRRFRAHHELGLTTIPARIFPRQLNDFELRSLELEENVQRLDLSWDERLRMEEEIHALQVAIHGEKPRGSGPDAPGHTIEKTAERLNVTKSSLSKDLKLVKAMKEFPTLPWSDCKNKHEASKLLKSMEKTLTHTVDAAAFQQNLAQGSQDDPSLALKKLLTSAYIIKDALKGLDDLPIGAFHLAEVDPPYAIELGLTKKGGEFTTQSYNEVAPDKYVQFLDDILAKTYRVMAPNSWMIFWFAMEPWFDTVYQAIQRAGFKCSRNCGVWVKNYGATNSPTTTLASCYDSFFYARKGSPELVKPGRSNAYIFDAVPSQSKYHPTQRPLALLDSLFRTFAAPNSRVVVPFAGSGVSLKAAALANMTPIGFDLSQDYRNGYLASLDELS